MTDRLSFSLSRRSFLAGACSAAAVPLMSPVTFAAMPGDRRFVTIVLRGAMDGLDLVQPYGDKAFAAYRPLLALTPDTGLIDLDGRFGLHPAAAPLMPLWKAGELSFVHAVSTPYRDQRSHFDGQDILESGGAAVRQQQTGWLNRALAVLPRSDGIRAIDINTSMELILEGPNAADVWSTRSSLAMKDDELEFFRKLYADDPAFSKAMAEAMKSDMAADELAQDQARGKEVLEMARLAGGMLHKEYRIAAFSLNGWDTHVDQKRAFARAAGDLATALTTLKETLGPEAWSQTVVLAMTEFGRTVRENGSKGTDHGTGGLALVAGGAIDGGRVLGDWPGLGEGRLLDDRDLMPTADVREVAAAMLHRQFDAGFSDLSGAIFNDLSIEKSSPFLRI